MQRRGQGCCGGLPSNEADTRETLGKDGVVEHQCWRAEQIIPRAVKLT